MLEGQEQMKHKNVAASYSTCHKLRNSLNEKYWGLEVTFHFNLRNEKCV